MSENACISATAVEAVVRSNRRFEFQTCAKMRLVRSDCLGSSHIVHKNHRSLFLFVTVSGLDLHTLVTGLVKKSHVSYIRMNPTTKLISYREHKKSSYHSLACASICGDRLDRQAS